MDPFKLKRLKQMEILKKFSLENRIAIGTVAGGGIGEAMDLCFAGAGAYIVIAELDVDRGKAVERKARSHGHKPHFLKVAIQLSAAT